MELPIPLYLVQGCGVSILCPKASVVGWALEIIAKGGAPTVQRIQESEV